MHREKSAYFWYNHLFWAILLIGVCFFFLRSSPSYSFPPFEPNSCKDFSGNWKLADGSAGSLTDLHTKDGGFPSAGIRLVKQLPSHLKYGTALNFRSKNVNFRLSIGGKTRYSFAPDLHNIVGKSYGSCFHSIPLRQSDAGKTVVLTAYPAYGDNSSFFNFMSLGNSGAYVHAFLRAHILSYLMCVTIIIFGLIMLILSLTSHGSGVSEFNMQSLGALALILGCWSCMQTLVPQMLSGSAVFIHGLNYLLLMMLPYPAIQFTNSLLNAPQKRYPRIASGMVLAVFLACGLLNYFQVLDFHESLPLVHLSMVFTVVLIGLMFFRDRAYSKQTGARRKSRPLLVAFFSFVGLSLVDLGRYAFSKNGTDDAGYFMRIGMLLFFSILFVHSFRLILSRMKLAGKTEAMRHIAYTDALTGIPNRAAFLKKEKDLITAMAAGGVKQILVCQFDINDLKFVNDTYGHASGDCHIKAAATILNHSFGKYGFCFRVGGDEFTAFLLSDNAPACYQQCYSAMIKGEYRYNYRAETKFPLRIACGQALLVQGDGSTLEQAEMRADRDMYETKRQMKAAAD